MKGFLYIVLILFIGSPVFAIGSPGLKKHKSIKLVKSQKKDIVKKKYKTTEKHPVPKVSIKNSQAIYDN